MTDELMHRARELEATLRALCGFDANVIRDLLAEVERLQSRLRELASAEPVLWYSEKTGVTDDRQHGTYTTALIRRPEMP